MNPPFLSIITVVHNAADSIDACLRSIREQQFTDFEHIVIDGASTDGTRELLEQNRRNISHLVSEPDAGIYDAMNKGLALAHGKFVHFLNATDRYHDGDVLADVSKGLEEGAVCYGDLIYVDKHGRERNLGRPYDWSDELRASRVPQPTLFVPLALYRAVGGFDLRYRVAADYEMFLRLAKRFPVKYIPRPVTTMYAGGLSYQKPRLAFGEARDVAIRYGMPRLEATLLYYAKLLRFTAARIANRI